MQYGDTVYLAGVVAKNLDQDIKGQTKQVLDDIDRLLAKCGSSKSKVLSAQIWVTDIRNRAPMNEVWTAWVDEVEPPGARLRRGEARRPEGAGRDHGDRREVAANQLRAKPSRPPAWARTRWTWWA